MLKTIINKEILLNFLSYKFSIIIILSIILILVSIFVMSRGRRSQKRLISMS